MSGVRQRNGVSIGRVDATEDGLTASSYGVWGEHGGGSAFLTTGSFLGAGFRAIMPFYVGYETGSNPVGGTASWSGAMAGVRVGGSTIGEEVTGDADMTADLAAATVDLTLSAIAAPSGARSPDIAWQDVPMRSGAFDASGLQGRFYGPGHAEAGGVFRHDGIEGVFSLARD